MNLRVMVGAAVLSSIEGFLTDRGADGAEGTGLVACRQTGDGWWQAVCFVAPDQRATTSPHGCSVEVTTRGKEELISLLPASHLYLVRVHSHPGEAFHSPTDDANPALTHEGALSVVVPYFGLGLRRGLDRCAVLRRTSGSWADLPPGPARGQWLVTSDD